MSAAATSRPSGTRPVAGQRPQRPPRSAFGPVAAIGAIALTVAAVWATDFSLAGVLDDLSRPNSSIEGLRTIDWSQVTNARTASAFVETLQMAVVGTVIGGFAALPLALWNSRVGAPNAVVFWVVKGFNNVVRAIPDVLWALLFVAMVGTGALPGILALVFFSIAVVSKLTSDVLDGIDQGPVEAAHATGAGHTQMLRTAIVPQVLPAYSSFVLYSVELNLRASAVLGLVGAGGIGTRIEFYRGRGEWSEVWGIIVLFFIVTFVAERASLTLRRRLV